MLILYVMDILKLRHWYRTPTGQAVRCALRDYFNKLLPEMKGKRVLVLGYGEPYAGAWQRETFVSQCHPGWMGVMHWPKPDENRALLAWENALPFPNDYFDAVFVIHTLEHSGHDAEALEEITRILRPETGLAIIVVPNRNGAWSRRDDVSPFGIGRPYSFSQLSRLQRESGLTCTDITSILHVPPTRMQWLLNYAATFEAIGSFCRMPFGGVLVSVAHKEEVEGAVLRTTVKKARHLSLLPAVGAVTEPS